MVAVAFSALVIMALVSGAFYLAMRIRTVGSEIHGHSNDIADGLVRFRGAAAGQL
jgi:hypothetical protein